jgi:hypothetical protein
MDDRGGPAGEIAGRVLNGGGTPLAEATVMITSSPGPHPDIAALTGSGGEFSFRGLPPGEYTLLANAPGSPPQSRSVAVRLGEAAVLDFTVDAG